MLAVVLTVRLFNDTFGPSLVDGGFLAEFLSEMIKSFKSADLVQ